MLLFIAKRRTINIFGSIISIHLMLLFIHGNVQQNLAQQRNFNTSHVTVYHIGISSPSPTSPFQYISCYCLSEHMLDGEERKSISIHLMLLFIIWHNRNLREVRVFQYISCYCLSEKQCRGSQSQRLFQYISCYCLSKHSSIHGSIQ